MGKNVGGAFLMNRQGLRGVKLVISDSHEGIKAAAAKTLKATWRRCRVEVMRDALPMPTRRSGAW